MTVACQRPLVLGAVVLAAVAATPRAQRGRHVDPDHGFSLSVPPRWSPLPVAGAGSACVAAFRCPRSYEQKTEYARPHVPVLRVYVFGRQEPARQPADPSAPVVYRSYREYLDDGLGRAFAADVVVRGDRDKAVDGVPCRRLSLAVTDGARRLSLMAWVFDLGDREVAVEAELLEDHAEKLAPVVLRTLASFRRTERPPAAAPPVPRPLPPWVADAATWRALPAGQRRQQRQDFDKELRGSRALAVPAGWKEVQAGPYRILSHASAKFTRRAAQAAVACHAWIEAHFGAINDEYVMAATILLFADSEEQDVFTGRGSKGVYRPRARCIVCHEDRSSGTDRGFGRMFQGQLRHFLHDKDPFLHRDMPAWLRAGLDTVMASALARGRRLEFVTGESGRAAIRELLRRGAVSTPRAIITGTAPDPAEIPFALGAQRALLTRLLLAGAEPFGTTWLVGYLQAVSAVIEVMGRARPEPRAPRVQDEKAREERAKAAEAQCEELLAKVNAAVFDWSDEDWSRAEVAFRDLLKREK